MPQEHDQIEQLPEVLRPHNREAVQRFNPATRQYEWVTVVHDWHDETPAAAGGEPPLVRGEDFERP
jgi:hypothetical protein